MWGSQYITGIQRAGVHRLPKSLEAKSKFQVPEEDPHL